MLRHGEGSFVDIGGGNQIQEHVGWVVLQCSVRVLRGGGVEKH